MAKTLGDKYIAGFLDGDGCITLQWQYPTRDRSNPEKRRANIQVKFTQLTRRDEVLLRIQSQYGGYIYYRKGHNTTNLTITGKDAVKLLSRVKQYLVLKRRYAEVLLEMHGQTYENKTEMREYMKEQRTIKSLPVPKHPTRGWMAGYVDADGTLVASVWEKGNRTNASITLQITCSSFDSEGIETLQQFFGGKINPMKNNTLKRWRINIPASKAEKVLGYYAKHSIIKADQTYFVLGCSKMKHFRDGKNIKKILSDLKAQPQRLSELSSLIKEVEDIQKPTKCSICGDTLYAKGLCRKHYDFGRNKNKR